MRPGILHGRRQRDRLTFDQLRARDIHVVMREIGADVGIERDFLGRRLRGRPIRVRPCCLRQVTRKVLRLNIGIPPVLTQCGGLASGALGS